MTLIICALCCAAVMASVLFFPNISFARVGGRLRFGRAAEGEGSAFTVDTYWICALVGAVILLVSGLCPFETALAGMLADTAVNPLKILVLFLSMTMLSVFLDELGFFRFLAIETLRFAGANQKKLFFLLYLVVSVLTVFTSNDIIILTFTPFLCYFAKNAGISAIPYLFAEFVAANTWSMALMIGNPTNIYLSSYAGIDFLSYAGVMVIPTVAAGLVALAVLYLLFRQKLKKPIERPETARAEVGDRAMLAVGIAHLGLCTLCLALSSVFGFEMWAVSLGFALSLFVFTALFALFRREKPRLIPAVLRRAPWQLIPFVLSMFVIVTSLSLCGFTGRFAGFLGTEGTVWRYGVSSFLCANLINNIPMSVLFCELCAALPEAVRAGGVYAAVVGSNLGALFTPIGALAGIMWAGILKKNGEKMSFGAFVRYGACVSLPSLAAALAVLCLFV